MGSSSKTDPRVCLGTPAELPDMAGLARFLHQRHRVKTAIAVGALCDFPAGTVENWLTGRARPGLGAALRLVQVYGPDVLAALYGGHAPDWLSSRTRAAKAARARAALADLDAALADLMERKDGQRFSQSPGGKRKDRRE